MAKAMKAMKAAAAPKAKEAMKKFGKAAESEGHNDGFSFGSGRSYSPPKIIIGGGQAGSPDISSIFAGCEKYVLQVSENVQDFEGRS